MDAYRPVSPGVRCRQVPGLNLDVVGHRLLVVAAAYHMPVLQ